MINYANQLVMPQLCQFNQIIVASTIKKEVYKMIDPSDISVPTIEYLFEMQIMQLTAATIKKRPSN